MRPVQRRRGENGAINTPLQFYYLQIHGVPALIRPRLAPTSCCVWAGIAACAPGPAPVQGPVNVPHFAARCAHRRFGRPLGMPSAPLHASDRQATLQSRAISRSGTPIALELHRMPRHSSTARPMCAARMPSAPPPVPASLCAAGGGQGRAAPVPCRRHHHVWRSCVDRRPTCMREPSPCSGSTLAPACILHGGDFYTDALAPHINVRDAGGGGQAGRKRLAYFQKMLRYSDMASSRFSQACVAVSPWDMQPRSVGTVATYHPSSPPTTLTAAAYLEARGGRAALDRILSPTSRRIPPHV